MFLESPPAAAAAALVAEAREAGREQLDDRRIGAYRLVREIGRGGMSRVFLAERADGEFEQRVALKVLRPGLDSEIDLERFRAERQILASLNHPNIARLLDGGVSDDGLPYPGDRVRRGRADRSLLREAKPLDAAAARAVSSRWPTRRSTRTGTSSCIATSSRRTSS